ncbi:hypothetical protein C9374_004405 [Naegleria lovaniensis]|uniref:Sodium/calcium exchanger membrane region domain-containing protein n=1 Tax=Naegleria lovaniensis TaxID=51637 RepID=A0AA88GRY7_NAELO|nr:uncharacterized protein C9374_004405 [Naegleria lovaniensis]KAG2383068.1 hypothetical protein C9374_004405 [Naegleria lovaniensis]
MRLLSRWVYRPNNGINMDSSNDGSFSPYYSSSHQRGYNQHMESPHQPTKTYRINGYWMLIKGMVIVMLCMGCMGLSYFEIFRKASWSSNESVFHVTLFNSAPISLNNLEQPLMLLNRSQNFASSSQEDSTQENTKICTKISTYELDQCQFAKENCMSPLGGMLNYLLIRYCTFQNLEPLFYVLATLWMVFLFYMLSTTAEDYFCPSLAEISRILRLSPDIAGVTFLSFGNGAPDIFSTIAGIFSGSTGFGLGEPIGSGLFICSVLLACVTLVVKEAKVSAFPFLRDVITYLISVTFVFVIVMVDGSINLWQSISFLAIYVAYVVFVIGSKLALNMKHKIQKKTQEKRRCIINGEDSCVVCDSTSNSSCYILAPYTLHLVSVSFAFDT